MENFATKSLGEKIAILQEQIKLEEGWLENTSNPMKLKWRRRDIKNYKNQLKELLNQKNNVNRQ